MSETKEDLRPYVIRRVNTVSDTSANEWWCGDRCEWLPDIRWATRFSRYRAGSLANAEAGESAHPLRLKPARPSPACTCHPFTRVDLGATDQEYTIDAARRVVAERHALKTRVEELETDLAFEVRSADVAKAQAFDADARAKHVEGETLRVCVTRDELATELGDVARERDALKADHAKCGPADSAQRDTISMQAETIRKLTAEVREFNYQVPHAISQNNEQARTIVALKATVAGLEECNHTQSGFLARAKGAEAALANAETNLLKGLAGGWIIETRDILGMTGSEETIPQAARRVVDRVTVLEGSLAQSLKNEAMANAGLINLRVEFNARGHQVRELEVQIVEVTSERDAALRDVANFVAKRSPALMLSMAHAANDDLMAKLADMTRYRDAHKARAEGLFDSLDGAKLAAAESDRDSWKRSSETAMGKLADAEESGSRWKALYDKLAYEDSMLTNAAIMRAEAAEKSLADLAAGTIHQRMHDTIAKASEWERHCVAAVESTDAKCRELGKERDAAAAGQLREAQRARVAEARLASSLDDSRWKKETDGNVLKATQAEVSAGRDRAEIAEAALIKMTMDRDICRDHGDKAEAKLAYQAAEWESLVEPRNRWVAEKAAFILDRDKLTTSLASTEKARDGLLAEWKTQVAEKCAMLDRAIAAEKERDSYKAQGTCAHGTAARDAARKERDVAIGKAASWEDQSNRNLQRCEELAEKQRQTQQDANELATRLGAAESDTAHALHQANLAGEALGKFQTIVSTYGGTERDAIVSIVSRVAQHACRQGETGGRTWPVLARLPFLESWRVVGETYVDQVAAVLAVVRDGAVK